MALTGCGRYEDSLIAYCFYICFENESKGVSNSMLNEVTKVRINYFSSFWNSNLIYQLFKQLLKRIIEVCAPSKSIRNQSINRSYVNKIRHEPTRHMRQRLKNPYDILMFTLNRKYNDELEDENEGIICSENDMDDDIDMDIDGQFINYLQGRHLLEHVENNHQHGDSLLDSIVDKCSSNNNNFSSTNKRRCKKIIPNQNLKLRSLLDRIFAEVEKYASKLFYLVVFLNTNS